ncbi:MAG: LysR family transcriptional regulator [Rhodospirillales bacterium]|nr:LysR family transcriptional regulator [Rhodospirillales bacterium]
MNRSALHLNALRTFEAAARHLSFSRAAEELHVTHSAISHQIRRLEETLGHALFVRTNRGVSLTEAGATLLPVLGDAFDCIGTTLDGLAGPPDGTAIKVTTTPTFAAKWLIPHLADWSRQEPTAPVHLDPTLSFVEPAGLAADVAIRSGIPPWPGLEAELVRPITLSPVCRLDVAQRLGSEPDAGDLLSQTLIHADIAGHDLGEEWRWWLEAQGVTVPTDLPGLSFRDPNLAFQAAIDGVGLAMGYLELAARDLDDGRLVRPFAASVRHPFSYYLVYRDDRIGKPTLAAFRNWLCQVA